MGFVAHAFDRLVVEVDVRNFDFRRERIGVDGEAVVLRSDGNLSGAEVFDRLVATAMTELQLEGGSAVGVGEKLVTEADAEDRFFADELAEFAVDIAERGRIAGAVGEEDAVGIFGEDFGGAGCGVHHLDFEARLAQAAQDVEFDAKIVCDDAMFDRRKFFVRAGLVGGDIRQDPAAGFIAPEVGFGR